MKERIQVTAAVLDELHKFFARNEPQTYLAKDTVYQRTKLDGQIINLSMQKLELYRGKRHRDKDTIEAIKKLIKI